MLDMLDDEIEYFGEEENFDHDDDQERSLEQKMGRKLSLINKRCSLNGLSPSMVIDKVDITWSSVFCIGQPLLIR